MGKFSDRGFVVITGAAGNFGAAMAKKVVEEGGSVLLIDTPALTKPLEALRDYLADRAAKIFAAQKNAIKRTVSGTVLNQQLLLQQGTSSRNGSSSDLQKIQQGNINGDASASNKPVKLEDENSTSKKSSNGPSSPLPPGANSVDNSATTTTSSGAPVAATPNGPPSINVYPPATAFSPGSRLLPSPMSLPHLQQPRVLMFTMDVRIDSEIAKMENFLEQEKLIVYGLFNNAGIQGEIQPIYDTTVQDFENVIQVNVVGAFKVLRSVTKYMKDRGQKGAVVSTSSTAWNGVPNMIGYSMSKAAVVGMTGSAGKDLAPFGIRVNCISPGHVGGTMWDRKLNLQAKLNTQYWPHGDPKAIGEAMLKKVPQRRAADVTEIINVVSFLLSEEASFMTGENVRVAGGDCTLIAEQDGGGGGRGLRHKM
ncbi:unnamed protein product [Amoebophrya sp. A120]|nr:unnamed protein product [Amoebophrya sp. A120]|eukprot:GSA120T00003803001.1